MGSVIFARTRSDTPQHSYYRLHVKIYMYCTVSVGQSFLDTAGAVPQLLKYTTMVQHRSLLQRLRLS